MLIDEWWRRLRLFIQRERYATELEEEMRLHLELRAEANRASGMTAEDAEYAARRRFGNRGVLQQTSRVRFSGDGVALARNVTTTIKDMAPELSVTTQTIQSFRERMTESLGRLQALIVLLCAIAIMLAVIGIYGVVAFAVSQRTKELAIRLALGARDSDMYRAVLGSSGRPVATGIVIGLAFTVAMVSTGAKVFRDGPFALQVGDPVAYTITGIVLAAMALTAMLVPARRATRVDPMEVLRHE